MFISVIFLQKEYSHKAALLYLLICCASAAVWYQAIEIRYYGMLFFLMTSIAITTYYVVKTAKWQWWILLSICIVAAIGTHFYALPPIGLMSVVLLSYFIKIKDKQQIKKAVICAVIVLVALSPLVQMVEPLIESGKSPRFITKMSWGVFFRLAEYPFFTHEAFYHTIFIVLFMLAIVTLMLRQQSSLNIRLSGVGILLPIASLIALSALCYVTGFHLTVRYFWISCMIGYLCFAIGLSFAVRNKLFVLTIFVLLLTSGVSFANRFTAERSEDKELNAARSAIQTLGDTTPWIFGPKLAYWHRFQVVALLEGFDNQRCLDAQQLATSTPVDALQACGSNHYNQSADFYRRYSKAVVVVRRENRRIDRRRLGKKIAAFVGFEYYLTTDPVGVYEYLESLNGKK